MKPDTTERQKKTMVFSWNSYNTAFNGAMQDISITVPKGSIRGVSPPMGTIGQLSSKDSKPVNVKLFAGEVEGDTLTLEFEVIE